MRTHKKPPRPPAPRRDVGLPLGRDDDARVAVVEAVLGEAHERGVLLDEQDEERVGRDVGDLFVCGGVCGASATLGLIMRL